MKLNIHNTKNENKGSMELPQQFNEPIRQDLIKRAVEVLQANKRQVYGAFTRAGKGHVTYISKRRRDYKTTYGRGSSRTPRKIMSRNGTQMNWVGAGVAATVGGRRSHTPLIQKTIWKKINKVENRKAIRSALSAVISKMEVTNRGHKIPSNYPFIAADDFETISKTKDVIAILEAFGFKDELARCEVTKTRAGVGKLRGRRKIMKKGPLLVVSKDCPLQKAANSIPGVEVCTFKQLNAELLAPGAAPGRATIFTQSAIKNMESEKVFL